MKVSLVLASSSPRRQELLIAAGFEFETVAALITERSDVDLSVVELTTWNALRKGSWVVRRRPDNVVLAADTLVSIDGRVLGKPRDLHEAVQMLQRLSGRVHEVCTSVFLGYRAAAKSISFSEISHVRFRKLNAARISDYFSRVNPLDKAGAYAAQGHGSEIIADVQGSFSNVVGLPMEKTTEALHSFGIMPVRPAP